MTADAFVDALPQPALLLDDGFRIHGANAAAQALFGKARAALGGIDPADLEPPDSRAASRAERGTDGSALRKRVVDGGGAERWFDTTVVPNPSGGGWLMLWHEVSAEVGARGEARRAHDELLQWFELAGAGMLVFDADSGFIVRCNTAFESMLAQVPDTLADAEPELQALLGFADGAAQPALVPGAPPIEREALVTLRDGRRRRLGARLACHAAMEAGRRRVMAVVHDRSAEDDRDLAQLEMGVLMDTASVGVATYDPERGWLATPTTPVTLPPGAAPRPSRSGALQGIGRDLVEPSSLPEFERLQRALRRGERAEVRYAVRHPELGARWLLTRVEPGALAGGRSATSVVTLDVTDQERALRRNEQLLRELTTILDSSTAGIAYLRGAVLVRCNRRFERMLGFAAGAAAGASLQEIFARSMGALPGAQQALQAIERGQAFEAELPLAGGKDDAAPAAWYSLSVRRAHVEGGQIEAVAALVDITRLKAQQAELEQLLRDRELMFSLSDVGIVYQRGARIERANEAMAKLTGRASPELSTLDVAELYEDARACVAFEGDVAQALRTHGRFAGERLLKRRDGSLMWVQVAVRPVDDADPGAGVVCSFVDIDERRRTRERLSQQAEQTRAILNSVLVGIVTVSDGGIEWMNRSAQRMFGGDLADFVGEPVSIVATPEPDHPLRSPALWHDPPDGRSEAFECRLKGRDGREFWVVGNAVLTRHGHRRELTIALLDIERRRQAEMRIATAQASLQRVLETAPLAIALVDARTFELQQANQTARAFFGRGPAPGPGVALDDCCTAAQAAALRALFERAQASEHVVQQEWCDDDAADGSGTERVWDCRVTPIDNPGGEVDAGAAQLLLVASDVTEQRAAERARLAAAIAQREVLVREVHHRIKNNLQGVAGLLQQNAARRPELAGALSEAVGQVQAIAQVYGLQVGASGPLQAATLLRAIAASVQRTFGRTIDVEQAGAVPHLLPETEAIPVALTVNELLTNAIKHGGDAAVRCTIEAAAGDARALSVTVANAGTLPDGFDVASVRGGVSGLGLVRALLPRRSAKLELRHDGAQVRAEITLEPPSVVLPPVAAPAQSAP